MIQLEAEVLRPDNFVHIGSFEIGIALVTQLLRSAPLHREIIVMKNGAVGKEGLPTCDIHVSEEFALGDDWEGFVPGIEPYVSMFVGLMASNEMRYVPNTAVAFQALGPESHFYNMYTRR